MKTLLTKFLKSKTVLFCMALMMSVIALKAQTYYYPITGNTDLSQTSNWTTERNGSAGTSPANFTTAGQIFDITNYNNANNANPTIGANWVVSGAGSEIIIGDSNAVNFTIPSLYSLTGTINNIKQNATLTIGNAGSLTSITWTGITVDPASTIYYLNLGNVTTVPEITSVPTLTYGNVTFDGTTYENAGTTTFTLAGNLTLKNSGGFNPGGVAGTKGTINLSGGNNQTLTGNGLTFQCYNLSDTGKTGGNVTLATNTPITFNNSLWLKQSGAGNVFSDGANNITLVNNFNGFGSASGFNLTGTLILSGTSGTQKLTNNNNYTAPGPAVATFNNITISNTGTGKTSFITNSSNAVINIKGSLINNTLTSTAAAVTLVSNSPTSGVDTFNIGGNFTNNNTTVALVYNAKTVYNFNGSSAQALSTKVASETITNLNISNTNANGVTLSSPFSLSGNFNLNKGLLNTTSTNILTMAAGSTTSGGTSTSYVNGPLKKVGNTAFAFPVGGNSHYAPIGISAPATVTDAFVASYAFACASTTPTVSGLTNVSADEVWSLNETAGTDAVSVIPWWESNTASGIHTYDATLVVAYNNGGTWNSIGQSAITATSPGNVSSNSTIPPATGGQYTFGSTNKSSNWLTQPIAASAFITDYNCGGLNTGVINAGPMGGDSVYNYVWTPSGGSSITASSLSAGGYSVTVTDANGCSATSSASIPTGLSTTNISSTTTNCGSSTGTATVTPSGGTTAYTYAWSNSGGGTTAGITALSAGTYSVSVTDKNGCISTASVAVNTPTGPRDSIISTINNLCYGEANGSATVGIKNGTLPYTFSWSTGSSTTATESGLTAGSYTVNITDAAGCQSSSIATLVDPAKLRDSVASFTNGCSGEFLGSATAGVKGGTGAYTYSWNTSPVQTNATAIGLSAGTYTLTIRDANTCSSTSSVTITPASLPSVTFNLAADSVKCDTVTQLVLTSLASPAGGVFRGLNISGNIFHPSAAGDGKYAIEYTYTNGGGCSDSAQQIIRVHNCAVTTGINSIQNGQSKIEVYPNPNNGQFSLSGLNKGVTIEIYNELGMLIVSTKADNEIMPLNITDKPSGIYLVRVIGEDGMNATIQKIIKQ